MHKWNSAELPNFIFNIFICNMKNKKDYLKITEEYIDYILSSNLSSEEIIKKEYPGIITHDREDTEIAKEVYTNLKEMCSKYQDGEINANTLSDFCANIMYSKYAPRVIQKIVSDEIYNALDYISELDFYLQK